MCRRLTWGPIRLTVAALHQIEAEPQSTPVVRRSGVRGVKEARECLIREIVFQKLVYASTAILTYCSETPASKEGSPHTHTLQPTSSSLQATHLCAYIPRRLCAGCASPC